MLVNRDYVRGAGLAKIGGDTRVGPMNDVDRCRTGFYFGASRFCDGLRRLSDALNLPSQLAPAF